MEKYAKQIEILKEYNGKSLRTKELKDLGITFYYLKKLEEANLLMKERYGVYKVQVIKEMKPINKEIYMFYDEFINKVGKKKYRESYYSLKKNAELQADHHFDSYLYISFSLLKTILKNSVDFSILSTLERKSDNKSLDSFIESIEASDFKEAKKKLQQLENVDEINVVTWGKLLDEILLENEISLEESRRLYYDFQNSLKKEDYETALEKLTLSYQGATKEDKTKYDIYLHILRAIIDVKTRKRTTIQEKDYIYFGSCFQIFYKALDNNDFLTAYKNVGKCYYNSPTAFYQTCKTLLHDLRDNDLIYFARALRATKTLSQSDEDKLKEKLKELLKKDNYDEAYALLSSYNEKISLKKSSLPRYLYFLLTLLRHRKFLLENKKAVLPINQEEISTLKFEDQILLGINNRDFHFVIAAIEKELPNLTDEKLEEYTFILNLAKEVYAYNNANCENNKRHKEKVNTDQQIAAILQHYNKITDDELDALFDLATIKFSLAETEEEKEQAQIILNILYMIYQAKTENFRKSDFCDFSKQNDYTDIITSQNIVKRLQYALRYGEYMKSLDILFSYSWENFSSTYKVFYLNIIKKLLLVLTSTLSHPSVRITKTTTTDIEESTLYTEFITLIENDDYSNAFAYYLKNNLSFLDVEEVASLLLLATNNLAIDEEKSDESKKKNCLLQK